MVSVTAAGTQSCPLRAMSLLVWPPARDSGEDKTDAPVFRTKNILSQISFLFLYIYFLLSF